MYRCYRAIHRAKPAVRPSESVASHFLMVRWQRLLQNAVGRTNIQRPSSGATAAGSCFAGFSECSIGAASALFRVEAGTWCITCVVATSSLTAQVHSADKAIWKFNSALLVT